MWIYWFQSVTIGLINFVRILQLKDFSTEGFKVNGQPVEPTPETRNSTAFFFLFHYGFFHFGYLIFLLTFTAGEVFGGIPTPVEFQYIFLTSILFFFNHLFSYFYNRSRDTQKQKIGALMGYPYARIIPMHFTIMFGFFGVALPLFLILKTFADCIMHIVEHGVLRKDELPANGNSTNIN